MNDIPKLATLAGITLAAANLVSTTASGGGEYPPPPEPPPIEGICHNIGGPRDLGANCDGTGTCTFTVDIGEITVPVNRFLGIVIPPTSEGAIAAHIAHGDGPILVLFDPPLHLASEGQNHQASNVECLGERVFPQPPEPGN